jgi:exonuclease VII small subunit
MGNWTDIESFKRFAEKLAKDCQEGVKWEQRKLEWIREERAKQQKSAKSEAA